MNENEDIEEMEDVEEEVIRNDLEDSDDSLELADEVAGELRDDEGLPPPIKVDIDLPIKSQIEAMLFAASKPLLTEDLKNLLYEDIAFEEIEAVVKQLQEEYVGRQGGFMLEFIKGQGYQFQSRAEAGPLMERLYASRPRPLSRPALETMAIVAYRQPCTRAAVEFIRGVDSGSIIKNLMERDLIRCVGRREDAGRPMLFGTTDEFLRVFGIGNIKDLPTLQSFQPDSDTMKEALKDLEKIDEVNPEDFIADQSADSPEVSEGLIAHEEETIEAQAEASEEILAHESSDESPRESLDS